MILCEKIEYFIKRHFCSHIPGTSRRLLGPPPDLPTPLELIYEKHADLKEFLIRRLQIICFPNFATFSQPPMFIPRFVLQPLTTYRSL